MTPRALLPALLALLLTGCQQTIPDRILAERAQLPRLAMPTRTGSMYPLLKGGELIRVIPAEYGGLRAGDLVARMDANRSNIQIHRIIRNDGTRTMPRWVTKGDNCLYPDDGYMFEDRFIGKWEVIGNPTPDHRPIKHYSGLLLQVATQ